MLLRAVARVVAVSACVTALAGCRASAGAEEAGRDGGAVTVEPPWPGLTLDLTPDPARGDVAVAVRVRGPLAGTVREMRVAHSWGGTHGAASIVGPRARDAAGVVALSPRPDDGGPDDVFDLAEPPRGEDLELRYRASATNTSSPFALHVGRDGMSGVGHAFLLLPRFDAAIPVRVRIHVDGLRHGADAASSFGFGASMSAKATSEDLAHAVYVAGMLWREAGTADGGIASDDLVVLGDPPFDTRAAFDRGEGARAAIDRFFGVPRERATDPVHFVLVGQRGLGRAREGAYLTGSVGVWFDAKRTLDGPLGLVIAHELTHRYLGGSVRLVDAAGHEAGWFAEGFTVHVARRALLEGGLLSPGDFAADIDGVLGEGDDLPADYRRGALFAAWLDAELARASKGKVALDEVLHDLVERGGSLPVAALADAVRARPPVASVAGAVDRAVAKLGAGDEAPVELADGAFGACARRVVRERRVVDLGFDRQSVEGATKVVRGVARGSAAEAAGLRDGALVLRASLPDEHERDAKAEVDLLLADGTRVRYAAVTKRRQVRWEPGDLDACRAELADRRAQSSR